MPNIIRLSGPWGYALVFFGGVVLFLSIRAAWAAARTGGDNRSQARDLADAVLFWGGASAILGFLGQCSGAYLALNMILAASEISPQIVAEGFVISFVPTLFGLGILAFSLVVWVCVRLLPGGTGRPLALMLTLLVVTACGAGEGKEPQDLSEGVWALDAGQNLFLWDFATASSGGLSCTVHDLLGGLKFMETPCASASYDGGELRLEMPNGTRYEGEADLARGEIDGRLLYLDGSHRDAPLNWAPVGDYPTLAPRPESSGPYGYEAPEDLGDGWAVAHASERGVDPSALTRTVEAILQGQAGFMKSILVARGGTLILEEYLHGYGPEVLSPLMSCTKSVSSLLVGLAIQEGRISSVNQPLLDFFPEERSTAGEGWGDLTLEHLLTMSMALDWDPGEKEDLHGTGPDAFQEILARSVTDPPGTRWDYVNMNVNLLAGVLHQATGEQAEAFAARTLFGPLGISDWNWGGLKTAGFNLMDGSLRLRPRDMARIGVMVSNGGEWQGRQVIQEEWIQRSSATHLPADPPGWGYGYLWWTLEETTPDGDPVRAVFANGWGSQFIIVFPDLDLVVVTTGGNQENGRHLAIGEVLLRELLPGVGGESP